MDFESSFLLFIDEEIGAAEGIQQFLKTQKFKELNVGYSLDEGLASEDDTYRVYYAQRCTWCK